MMWNLVHNSTNAVFLPKTLNLNQKSSVESALPVYRMVKGQSNKVNDTREKQSDES